MGLLKIRSYVIESRIRKVSADTIRMKATNAHKKPSGLPPSSIPPSLTCPCFTFASNSGSCECFDGKAGNAMMCVFMGSAKASVTWYVQVRLTNCATENTLFNLGFIFVAQICFTFCPIASNMDIRLDYTWAWMSITL